MARKDKSKSSIGNMKNITNNLDNIDSKMGDIYRNTYSSRDSNKKELTRITDDIYDSVNKILSNNSDINGIPDISRLYTRMKNKDNDKITKDNTQLIEDITDIFQDKELLNALSANPEINRYIKSLDEQYDLICKYMPELEEALTIKKDNTLSSDNFTKEYINPVCVGGGIREDVFTSRCIELRRVHNLDMLFDEIIEETSKYGEYFLYIVPYQKALSKLIDKQKSTNLDTGVQFESYSLLENGKLNDTLVNENDLEPNPFEEQGININLQFDRGMLSQSIYNYKKARYYKKKNNSNSLYEAFITESSKDDTLKMSDKIFSDKLDYGKEFDAVSTDGLVNMDDNKNQDTINDMAGCIVKKLKHENVIPIYIEDVCVGYYYLEFGIEDITTNNIINSSTFPSHSRADSENRMQNNETMMKYLAAKMSSVIDAKFINNNQDLKEEIYVILKYNDKFNINHNNNIRVTFLPPEDVYHFYFRLDEVTHHGISVIEHCWY